MDITQLPDHIFIDIAKYLSLKDLFSCTLVNSYWRSAINCNDIWRYVCKNFIASDSGNELDYIPNLVAGYSNPYSAAGFESLCQWRTSFMRWQKMKNNWQTGNFKRFNISEQYSMFCENVGDDNVALLVRDDLRELSVWNIKLVPYHQQNIKFCLNHVRSEFVKLCKNYLVIVQCNLVQVFRFTDDGFVLHFRFIFDEPDSYSKKLPLDYNLTTWYCANIDLYPCDLILRCDQNGTYFIGCFVNGDCNDILLHIWNIDRKNKETEVLIPKSSDVIVDVYVSTSIDCLYLMIKSQKKPTISHCYHTLVVYDLKEFKFLNFRVQFTYVVPAYIVYKQFYLSVDGSYERLHIWKVKSKHRKTIDCDFEIDVNCFNVERSLLILGGKRGNVTVIFVYHLDNYACIFTTSVKEKVGFVSLIQNKFLIYATLSWSHYLSVVDLSNNSILYNIEDDDCVYVSSFHSKLLTRTEDKISLITFW